MKRKIIALALVFAVFAVTVDSAQACRRCRHRAPGPSIENNNTTNNYYSNVHGDFKFLTPYDFGATSTSITAKPCTGKFAIQLEGDSATNATYVGEKVKFTATCKVLLLAADYAAFEKTGNSAIIDKAINVTLEATLDAEGIAEFSKAAIYEAVNTKLARIRLWDQPSLFGLENFKIEVTGVARVGSFIFDSSNEKVLTGIVD